MKTKLFGMGAAGNKASILAVQNNVIKQEDVILINSTLTDIPSSYDGEMYELPGKVGGTGKDRNISKKQAIACIKNGVVDLEKILVGDGKEGKVKQAIFVTSTDGGSGSGSTVEFVKYIIDELKIPVMVFAFIGRARDIKGLRNTIEFFKELHANATVQIISNELCAENENDFNESKIEMDANSDFCRKLSITLGIPIENTDSEQNLDERELSKLRTTPGYMITDSRLFDQKIKNIDQVKKEAELMMDNMKSPYPEKTDMKRVGLIYNSEKEESQFMNILPSITKKFGMAYEVFTHRQYISERPRMIAMILSGLAMPTEEINAIYEKYREATSTIDKTKDGFYDTVKNMEFEDDSVFDDALDLDF